MTGFCFINLIAAHLPVIRMMPKNNAD